MGRQDFQDIRRRLEKIGKKKVVAPKHGCWENLATALRPHGVLKEDVPSPLNIFQTIVINAKTGSMRYSMTRPRPGGDTMDRAPRWIVWSASALVLRVDGGKTFAW